MKISLTWLKDYVTIGVPAEKLAHRLTMAGMEVEKIEEVNGDTVFELEITPNRPDCLNLLGLARETAAVLNKTLKIPKARKPVYPKAKCDLDILDRDGCPRYIGTLIQGVTVSDAPEDMQTRLNAVGSRPINNIVDITNFCLFESGQPMHAFDHDKLIGGKIVVRRARKGETLVTLDGVERVLDPSILVIADAKRPVAIAGVMGGQETEVTRRTKNVLLECASFDPVVVRRGARKLGLSTEASYRFERSVDMENMEQATVRALSLIQKHCGGKIVARRDLLPGRRRVVRKKIEISLEQVNALLGSSLTLARCKMILKKLDCVVRSAKGEALQVTPPSGRLDLKQPVDLIEEIARIIGFDNLPMSLPQVKASQIPPDRKRSLKQIVRRALTAQGYDEIVTYSMTSAANLARTRLEGLKGVSVQNPLTVDQEMMRPDVLPNLLAVVANNVNRGQKDLRLFELGRVYPSSGEKEMLSLLLSGARSGDWRVLKKDRVDFYDLKGAVAAALSKLGVEGGVFEPGPDDPRFEGAAAVIKKGQKVLGSAGRVHSQILSNWDIKLEELFFAQLDMESILQLPVRGQRFIAVSEYPAVTRDISLAVPLKVTYREVCDVVQANGQELLADIRFVEEYRGEKIPDGQRGLVFSLLFQSSKRTLTEDEVNAVHSRICGSLCAELAATLR